MLKSVQYDGYNLYFNIHWYSDVPPSLSSVESMRWVLFLSLLFAELLVDILFIGFSCFFRFCEHIASTIFSHVVCDLLYGRRTRRWYRRLSWESDCIPSEWEEDNDEENTEVFHKEIGKKDIKKLPHLAGVSFFSRRNHHP